MVVGCQNTAHAQYDGSFTAYGTGTANVFTNATDTVIFKNTSPLTNTGPIMISVGMTANTALDSLTGTIELFVSNDAVTYYKPRTYPININGYIDSVQYTFYKTSTDATPPGTLTFAGAGQPTPKYTYYRTFTIPGVYWKYYQIRVIQNAASVVDNGANGVGVPQKTWTATWAIRNSKGF